VTLSGLEGEVALVTGGGRGFGRAISIALAQAGASVGVIARSRDQIDEVAAAIGAAGGQALAMPCDVADRAQVADAVAAVTRRFGPVSFLVNNAGIAGPYGPIAETDPDAWWQAQKIHLYAPLLFSSAVLPGMLARGGGRIVNVASRAAIMFQPGLSAYVVGKASQVKFTEHLDAETRDRGVRAFAIQPGDAPTDFAHATINDSGAKAHLPGMLEILGKWVDEVDPAPVLEKCAGKVVEIAAGRWDRVAGQYLDVDWDWSTTAVIERHTRHD
jgi:NAD(P)-dependent dehydrogenase (short-subunit alcohol dehydrogenase family)